MTGGSAYDVAVVGAGPAGLAATVAAVEAGLRVVCLDAGPQPGGQYWRHPDERAAAAEEHPGHRDGQVYAGLRDRLQRAQGTGLLDFWPSSQVWFVEPGAAQHLLRIRPVSESGAPESGPSVVRAAALILCPGAYDRQLPVPGWDLPGVMTAGGVQALWKGYRTVAGRRAVVAGTGPFLLPVAAALAQAGATVVAVCEANRLTGWVRHAGGALQVPGKAVEAAAYARVLARHRVPYRTGTGVTAVHGEECVTSATLSRLDQSGGVRSGGGRTVDVDLVAFGWGFTPSLELVVATGAGTRVDLDGSLVACVDDRQRSTVAGVYVAGEATGVGGADLAVAEGELAGRTAAGDRGRPAAAARVRHLQRRIARGRAFARTLHLAHPVPAGWAGWLTPETVVCRCEEVPYADVCRSRQELGAADAKTVKLLTRTGMGWCQGRICGYATAALIAAAAGRPLGVADLGPTAKRPLAAPVTLAELAALAADPAELL